MELNLYFKNGCFQSILICGRNEDGSLASKQNSMGHYSCYIVSDYSKDKCKHNYTGFDENGKVIYKNEIREKIWRLSET